MSIKTYWREKKHLQFFIYMSTVCFASACYVASGLTGGSYMMSMPSASFGFC